MVKSEGKEALTAAGLRHITALTDPQIRGLLGQGILQLSLFSEQVCEVQAACVISCVRIRLRPSASSIAGKIS